MNIALTALILTFILLPGAAVIRAYYTSLKERNAAIHIAFTDSLIRGLIFSLVIHSIAICILQTLGFTIDFTLLYLVLKGGEVSIPNDEFTKALLRFCFYNLVLTALFFGITKRVKRFIQQKNYDLSFYSLRNTNYWFQLFSGRYLDDAGVQGEREKTDMIFLDVLVKNALIYSGVLIDFHYKAEQDKLENIVLHSVRKRRFNAIDDKTKALETGIASPVPGDVLVIQSADITNINIYYIKLTFEKQETIEVEG